MKGITAWEDINRRVYWHRVMPLCDWRKGIAQGLPTYLTEAIRRMPVRDFIYYYGRENFKFEWPQLRAKVSKEIKKYCAQFDIAWSLLLTGSYNLQPIEDFFSWMRLKKQF